MVLYSTIPFSSVELYSYFLNICYLFLGLKTLYKHELQKGNQYRNIAWSILGCCYTWLRATAQSWLVQLHLEGRGKERFYDYFISAKQIRKKIWVKCCETCFGQAGLKDLQRPLITWTILWCCECANQAFIETILDNFTAKHSSFKTAFVSREVLFFENYLRFQLPF